MTTTVTTHVPRSAPHRFRRDLLAALAGAAFLASTALVVNRITHGESQQANVAAAPVISEPCGVGYPDYACSSAHTSGPASVVATQPMRLTINQAAREACGMGHADACPFAHTWAPVNGLEAIEDAARDLEHVLR